MSDQARRVKEIKSILRRIKLSTQFALMMGEICERLAHDLIKKYPTELDSETDKNLAEAMDGQEELVASDIPYHLRLSLSSVETLNRIIGYRRD